MLPFKDLKPFKANVLVLIKRVLLQIKVSKEAKRLLLAKLNGFLLVLLVA